MVSWRAPIREDTSIPYGRSQVHDSLDPILLDLVLLFAVCIAIVLVFHRLRMPPITGFLAAGALLGPGSLGLIHNVELIQYLAEIGVVVLLFTVGMELSLGKLLLMRRAILVTGGCQVLATTLLGLGVALLAGLTLGQGLFVGFLLTLSSTAAVTKLLSDRGEIGRPAGRIAVSICVAQDLAVVGMILVVPMLGGEDKSLQAALWDALRSFGWLAVIIAGGLVAIPFVLRLVSRTRSRELFVLAIITLCLALSVATAQIGASLALGAFLAGLILAGSDFRHQAVSEVEPFRDALGSLFFVSIGMLFDYHVILENPLLVLLSLGAVVLGKAALAFVAVLLLRIPPAVAFRVALMIAQVGEFSFVLVEVAGEGFLPEQLTKTFFVVAVLSISVTPLLFWLGQRLLPQWRRRDKSSSTSEDPQCPHVVIVGYGPLGRKLVQMLQALEVPVRVIEMNAATVKQAKAQGVPIVLGDASRAAVLESVDIGNARLLILASSDSEANIRTAHLARRLKPHLDIIARAIYLSELPGMKAAGIKEIVPQELETAFEIAARAMRHYPVPEAEVRGKIDRIREETYGMERLDSTRNVRLGESDTSPVEIQDS